MSDTKQNNFSEIGTRVADARGKPGLSQAALAAVTGISPSVIAGIEAGTYWPSSGEGNIQDLLRRIAAATSEDPNTLHGGSFDPATVGSLS